MTNKTEKMTNRKALSYIEQTYGENLPADVLEKVQGMIAQLDKKASAPRKATPTQVENEGYMTLVVNFLSDGSQKSVAEMIKGIPAFADFSTPKVSAIVKKLKDAGTVERVEVKGRAYFKLT